MTGTDDSNSRMSRVTGLLLLLLLALAGCESDSSGPSIKRPSEPLPTPSANVSRLQAWQDANLIASRESGREALVGGGTSMNPVYGDNTMLVVQPIDYDQLKAGMTVVYVNDKGKRVAHQLIKKEARGWRAQGIDNDVEDYGYVTPGNLVGVVYASLVSEDPDAPATSDKSGGK